MNISDSVNVELLNNVEESVKPILKELLQYIDIEQKEKNSFTPKQINKIISDLNSGLLQIKLASKSNESNSYTKRFEENPYLKGYYRHDNKNNKKLIVIREEDNKEEISCHLSHEMEHFIDENLDIKEKSQYRYDFWNENEVLKSKNDLEIMKKIEFSDENPRGAFLGNYINSDWLEMWDEASTEIISSNRIKKEPTGYLKRVDFLKAILKINNKTEEDLTQACRNGDITFIYNLMPKNLLINISKLETQLYESVTNSDLIGMNNNEYTMHLLDLELLEYINQVKENEIFKSIDDKEKEKIIESILNLGYSNDKSLTDRYVENKFINKFDMKCKKIFKTNKNESKNIDDISEYIYNWIDEIELTKKIDYPEKLKSIFLKNLVLEKKEELVNNGQIEEIDNILTEIENRMVHEEKINLYKKGLFEKAKKNNEFFLEEYINYEKIQKHYIYINGEKYLNNKFLNNLMTVNLYNIEPTSCYIKTIIENGEEVIFTEKTYDDTTAFLINSRNIMLKNKLNVNELEEFRKDNNNEIKELLSKGLNIVCKNKNLENKNVEETEKMNTNKENEVNKKETFISNLGKNINLQPSYIKNDSYKNDSKNSKLYIDKDIKEDEINVKGVNLENER